MSNPSRDNSVSVELPWSYRAYGVRRKNRSSSWHTVMGLESVAIRSLRSSEADGVIVLDPEREPIFRKIRYTDEPLKAFVVDGRIFYPVAKDIRTGATGSIPLTPVELSRFARQIVGRLPDVADMRVGLHPFALEAPESPAQRSERVLGEDGLRDVEWSDQGSGRERLRRDSEHLIEIDGHVFTSRYEPVVVRGMRAGANDVVRFCDVTDMAKVLEIAAYTGDVQRFDKTGLDRNVEVMPFDIPEGVRFVFPDVQVVTAIYLGRALRTMSARSDVIPVVGPGNATTYAMPDAFEDIALRMRRAYSAIVAADPGDMVPTTRGRELIGEFIALVENASIPEIRWSHAVRAARLAELGYLIERWERHDSVFTERPIAPSVDDSDLEAIARTL